MNAKTARTLNIRRLVARAGGPAAWSARFGGDRWLQPQVSQWINESSPKGIGDKLARDIETAMGIERDSLDRPPAARPKSPSEASPDAALQLESEVDGIRIAISGLISILATERPAEGGRVADVIRDLAGDEVDAHPFLRSLLATLDSAAARPAPGRGRDARPRAKRE